MNGFQSTTDLSIESLLGQAANEFSERISRGETPNIDEYTNRYPQIAELIRQVFPALGLLRELPDSCPNSDAPLAGTKCLGDFRVVREIGRGGMGVVYEAEQISLARHVALKVLPFAAVLDSRNLKRFKNEAQAAASLHHQNIVPVYGVGCERGVHYYAMQFIEGQTLAELIGDLRRLEGRDGGDIDSGTSEAVQERATHYRVGLASEIQRDAATDTGHLVQAVISTDRSVRSPAYFHGIARIGIQVAEALDHAHEEGVIHRDVKPSNLILDAQGKVWVTDFGLARVEADPGLTMTGDLLGTLRYMSPEQTQAKRAVVDHRTDIYSLAVSLYELMTLQPAFAEQDRQELLRRIAVEEPPPPRKLNPGIPADLETVLLKAMAKEPSARYLSARELADDLSRFLQDKPVLARRPHLLKRCMKWSRRHRALVVSAVTSTTVVMLLAVAILVAGSVRIRKALDDRSAALQDLRSEKARVEQLLERERVSRYIRSVSLARAELLDNSNVLSASRLLNECPEELRQWEWYYLRPLLDRSLRTFHGHSHRVQAVAFDPGGTRIVSASLDGTLRIWNLTDGNTVLTIEAHPGGAGSAAFDPDGGRIVPGGACAVAFSPDGQRIVSEGNDQTVCLWDTSTGKLLRTLTASGPTREQRRAGHEDGLGGVAFSPDGQHVASAAADGSVKLWDPESGKLQRVFAVQSGAVHDVAFSPDSNRLAVAGEDATLKVWSLEAERPPAILRGHELGVTCAAFAPDGQRIASGSVDRTIIIWDAQTGKALQTIRGNRHVIFSIAFDPDGKRIACGCGDNTSVIWDAGSGKKITTLVGHEAPVAGVAFSPDDRQVVSASWDGKLKLWDPATPEKCRTLREHRDVVSAVAFSPDGHRIVSGSYDKTLKVWDPDDGSLERTLEGHKGAITSLAFFPDANKIATASADKTARIWDLRTGRALRSVVCPLPVFAVAVSPDGNLLVTGCGGPEDEPGKPAEIWYANTGEQRCVLLGHTGGVIAAAFSPDGSRIVTGSWDKTCRVWETETGCLLQTFRGHTGAWITSVAFHPAGDRVVSCCVFDDVMLAGEIKAWSVVTGEELYTLHDGNPPCRAIAFSPDGHRLVAASYGTNLILFETDSGREVLSLHGHTREPECVAFSPDGRRIVSGGYDFALKLWEAPGFVLTGKE